MITTVLASLSRVLARVISRGMQEEATIAARAERISRYRPVGGDVENWRQAERAIQTEREPTAARARGVAAPPGEQGELDTWLRSERELTAAGRIAGASPAALSSSIDRRTDSTFSCSLHHQF
jgi:hypothetical protein